MSIEEERYKHVCTQLMFHQGGTRAAFTTFVQLATGIVGGAVWLSTQAEAHGLPLDRFVRLSDVLMIGVSVLTVIKIGSHMRAWWKWRAFLAALHAEHGVVLTDRGPRRGSLTFDFALIAAVIGIAVGFSVFNPFAVSHV